MAKITAICTSPQKGTPKEPGSSGTLIENWGLEGDAHAGNWHRQVSLLSLEKIEEFRKRGAEVTPGAFGENLVVEGIDFRKLPIGTRFRCGDCLLELTQIGKECHQHCAIFDAVGDCIMPREGVFARVLRGGRLAPGDLFEYTLPYPTAIITASDSGYAGQREDLSGPAIAAILENAHIPVSATALFPDDQDLLEQELCRLADTEPIRLILTTGGTGLAPRDCMPEATRNIIHREVPGIPEAMRQFSLSITPNAMLSRGIAGVRSGTLIINLPGSPKAVSECLSCVLPVLPHALELLAGTVKNCAR